MKRRPPRPTSTDTPLPATTLFRSERHAQVFRDALKDVPKKHIAFAIKCNPNLGVLRVLARQGYGADVVSGGELERALAAGMAAEDIVFSGVGKTRAELAQGRWKSTRLNPVTNAHLVCRLLLENK